MKKYNEDDENSDESDNGEEAELGVQFIQSCVLFLSMSQALRGENKPGEKVFSDICYQITGNRKDQPLSEAMPNIFQKVIDHCQESLAMADSGDTRI